MSELVVALIAIDLLAVYAAYSLARVWYHELHHGGWDEVYKPTTNFIAAMTGIVFLVVSVWIVATIYNSVLERQAEAILNPPMCVSESGHKPVPCPGESE